MTATEDFVSIPIPYKKTTIAVCIYSAYLNGRTSPRDTFGRLSLRANPLVYHRRFVRRKDTDPMGYGAGQFPFYGANDISFTAIINGTYRNTGDAWAKLENRVYSRFMGKVKSTSANLGVTLATYRQTFDMVATRAEKLAGSLKSLERQLRKIPRARRLKNYAIGSAGLMLEGSFGWVPLMMDLKDSLNTLARGSGPQWIRASASEIYYWSETMTTRPVKGWTVTDTVQSILRGTYSAKASYDENLFLMNRLGLVNLPGIAWDLVPWSFVMNMFSNMGQCVNSLTDSIGVTFSDSSYTRSASTLLDKQGRYNGTDVVGFFHTTAYGRDKRRSTGIPIPRPTLQFRLPDDSLMRATIAYSLVTQRLNRIQHLFR